MPIPSFPTGEPYSVEACSCCTVGNPAAILPRDDEAVFDDDRDGIDSYLSDAEVIAGIGGAGDSGSDSVSDGRSDDPTPSSGDGGGSVGDGGPTFEGDGDSMPGGPVLKTEPVNPHQQ